MWQRRFALLFPFLLLGGLLLLLAAPVQAGTVIDVTTVDDELNADGDCSLREALTAANTDTAVDACPAGSLTDTVQLAAAHYTIARAGVDDLTAGDWDMTSPLTLRGVTSATTVLDGAGLDRVLHVHPGTTVVVADLTLLGGAAHQGAPTGCGDVQTAPCPGEPGGGLLNEGTMTLESVTVRHNRTADGRGCGASPDDPCPAERASSGGDGGGLFNRGVMTVAHSALLSNSTGSGGGCVAALDANCRGGDGGRGAGIYNAGTLALVGSIVDENCAGSGGGNFGWTFEEHSEAGQGAGLFNAGNLTMEQTHIRHNVGGAGSWNSDGSYFPYGGPAVNPGGDGGGLYNIGTLVMRRSELVGNTTGPSGRDTGSGGGLFNVGTAHLVQSSVSGNLTWKGNSCAWRSCNGGNAGHGAGIFNRGVMTLTNATVVQNQTGNGGQSELLGAAGSGGDGGGIFNQGTLWLDFTTLAGNRTGSGADAPTGGSAGLDGQGGGIVSLTGTVYLHNSILAANSVPSHNSECSGTIDTEGYNLILDIRDCTLVPLTGSNLVGFDPRFAGWADLAGATALLLAPASPAVDRATCTTGPGDVVAVDQLGKMRPQGGGCDIGAVESPYTSTFTLRDLNLPLIAGDAPYHPE